MGKFYLKVFYNKTELDYNDVCIRKGILIDLWRKQISIHSMEGIHFICNYLILRFFPPWYFFPPFKDITLNYYYYYCYYTIYASLTMTPLFMFYCCFVFSVICFMQRALRAFSSDLDRLLLEPKAASRWCYGAGRLKLDRLLIRQRKQKKK